MTDPSPAADAVLDAYMNNCGWLDGPLEKDYRCAAAVLRAAADQASPKLHIEDIDYQHQSYVDGWNDSLELILAIAAELDNSP
jgi:hypothetical protein